MLVNNNILCIDHVNIATFEYRNGTAYCSKDPGRC